MKYANTGSRFSANSEGYADPTFGMAFPDETKETVKPASPIKFVYDPEYGNKLDWDKIVKIWL